MLMRLFGLWIRAWIRLHGGRRRIVRAGAYQIVLYELGPKNAEPWLLLHGLGATALSWTPLLKAFRSRCRMFIPELSILGGTRGPHPAIGVGESAEVLASLVKQAVPGRRVTLAGMSLGGWMAVRLTMTHPELIERLLLIDTAGWRDQDWIHVEDLVRLKDLSDVDRLYRALFVRTPWLLRHSRREFLQAYTSSAVTYVLDNTEEDLAFGAPELAQLEIAVGVIWAAHDGLFPRAVGDQITASLQNPMQIVVPDCGHGLHWERPVAFVDAVRRWQDATAETRH